MVNHNMKSADALIGPVEKQRLRTAIIFDSSLIITPILVMYYLSHGLNMSDVFLLQSIALTARCCFRIPGGLLCEYWGPVKTFRISFLLQTGIWLMMALYPTFAVFTAGEIFYAFSAALSIPAGLFALHSPCEEQETINTAIVVERSGTEYFFSSKIGETLASFLGGVLATINYSVVFLVQAGISLNGLLLCTMLRSQHIAENQFSTGIFNYKSYGTRESKQSIFLISTAMGGIGFLIYTFIKCIPPTFTKMQIPVAYFGLVWALLHGSMAAGAYASYKIPQMYYSVSLILGSVTLLVGIAGFLSTHSMTIALVLVAMLGAVNGALASLTLNELQHRIADKPERATLLGTSGIIQSITIAILSALLSGINKHTLLFNSVVSMSAISLILIVTVTYGYQKTFMEEPMNKNQTVSL